MKLITIFILSASIILLFCCNNNEKVSYSDAYALSKIPIDTDNNTADIKENTTSIDDMSETKVSKCSDERDFLTRKGFRFYIEQANTNTRLSGNQR